MKFNNLENKDIVKIIGYLNKYTGKPLYLDNTIVSIIRLDEDFTYKFNSNKELIINDNKQGDIDIPLDDKDIELFSEDDMLILVYKHSEYKNFNSFNVIIFNIEESILSDIMKIIEIEKNHINN